MATMADTDVVLKEDHPGGVRTLTFNRPDRLNAWTGAMGTRYFDLLDEAAGDPDVRVIVVTGAGRGFCAGADMSDLTAIGEQGGIRASRAATVDARNATHVLTIPKPVIAAVNGACAGIGFVNAIMCDVRYAAAGAKFTTAFARRGLVAEHGSSWILPRLTGPAAALDLLLSGRVFLAEEAAELGVVNKVFSADSLMDETLSYARDIAENAAPSSMAAMKHQVYAHLDTDLRAAMKESNRMMARSLAAEDFREGVASFLDRRPPKFSPIPGGPSYE